MGTLSGHKRLVDEGVFSPDGLTFATVSDDCMLKLWNVAAKREMLSFQLPLNDPTAGASCFRMTVTLSW
jgi:WD40 repeat protein